MPERQQPVSGREEAAPAHAPAPALSHWLQSAAQAWPGRIAIEADGGQLDYEALRNRVAAVAAQLRAAGIHAGDRIGIAATRSIDTIVAILAAVDAGIAYVPLDLGYPADRLRCMLDDAQPRAVLGEPAALDRLQQLVGAVPSLAQPNPATARPFAAADDLTYVLFTSGSTGRPKGVAMGATPLRELIAWHARHPRLGQAARTLQFAPLSFDVHFQEILSTVACAGTLVLVAEQQRLDPDRLRAALAQCRIERVFLPYVALQMIAEAAPDGAALALREVVSAGEQLLVTPAIRALFAGMPGAELHNHYGPTESHVVTAHELAGDPATWPHSPPIGRPLPHVAIALRDPDTGAVLASPQATGELLLGADALAHGYLGREELTAARFRSDIAGLPGRWYVTGDLVQRAADGLCQYRGRADEQLKIDGFRVEPAEIELALLSHPAVKEAVVTAPELAGIGRQLIAHVVVRDPTPTDLAAALRCHLRSRLPDYMVPVRYVSLARLPTTPSGKIDRRGLPLPELPAVANADPSELVRVLWQQLLGLQEIDNHANLFDLGARSLLVLRFIARLKAAGVTALTVADVYDRPSVASLSAALRGQAREATHAAARAAAPHAKDDIAIVGMALRVAGASDVDTFWRNLLDEFEGIRHFSAHELDPSVPAALRERPNFVAARGVLAEADRFDAAFFGIPTREATMLDPQQRLLLELAWTALEHAGIDPSRTSARIGVYAGTANNTYATALRQAQPELVQQYGEFQSMLASEKDYVATRIAHRLNLNGPAVSVHTACSTGLVAVVQAVQSLTSGQCDIALAGGATVIVPQEGGYLHVEGGMESADGHCRPFDANAAGTVFASGGAVVALKRLSDALADGDTIHAVIRGVGLNNDGGDKASFTAPSVAGQAAAIRMALDHAQVSARSIGYVEAHGTGTALGDPIEVAALTRAWRRDTDEVGYALLGSVKGNHGHLIAAAGVIGLIKAALTLQRGAIPATLHFRAPNPQINFAQTPFKVAAQVTPWPRGNAPRRAAVSSFGVGGTNAHVILEEPPAPPARADEDTHRRWVLPLSARTPLALLRRAQELAAHLQAHPELPLSDVAATLMRGRRGMAVRCAVVAASPAEAAAALRALTTTAATTSLARPRLVWLFPGQGSQHPGMARGLYDEVPAFHEALDRCLAIAAPLLPPEADLRAWLISADPADAVAAEHLAQTRYAQPALFCMSYALGAWLQSLGLRADAMIGHSIGEYAAACHAGVFALEDALGVVVARGAAMWAQPRGAMLAVRTGADALRPMLPPGIEIAGSNAPGLTVVAGPTELIDALAQDLASRAIGSTRLRVSHAFHSAAMDGALPLVAAAAARATLRAPDGLVYSCVSGAPLTAQEATDPHYWARQVRASVQFSAAVQAELAKGETIFVEVGPGQALTALLRQHRNAQSGVPVAVPLLGPASDPGDAAAAALRGLGALWCAGAPIAWPISARAPRATLPGYPFEGERHWFDRRAATAAPAEDAALTTSATASSSNTPATHGVVALPIAMTRLPQIDQELKRIFSEVSGLPAEQMTREATFVDQGLDSLSMTQASLEIERAFGVKLRFRRLLEDLDTLGKLAQFLDEAVPADKFAPPPLPASAGPGQGTAPALPPLAPLSLPALPLGANASLLQQVIAQQMQLMAQQLSLLAGHQPTTTATTVAPAAPAMPLGAGQAGTPSTSAPPEAAQPGDTALIDTPFGAAARITLKPQQSMTPAQRQWLDAFIARYNARSGKSKAFSQSHRKVMADPRVVTGFNPLWKDLVYPIVVDRSSGARLWDLDGNEYIDLLSCFGANLLGYQPRELVDAMVAQLQAGIEVGPQHPLSAEVASLIAEFTGMERVAFCNTGSEAVMGAMRIARTVTGRKTIAIFTNSYHGIFDEVIVRGTRQLRSLSAAPGILANAVENVLVLDWASDESLRVLRERGRELAAIMTEPIQNKVPTLQPREFVQALRAIADECGCALIFDEVVTGFRVAPGGAQEFYGVRADIATYGKIIGGGLPFAAIAGSARWLDALDGGHWQYGDDSYPEAGVTYFAGTFVRHPLALAAAKASLLHLKAGGPALYRGLNERTQRLIDRLNTAFSVRGAPVRAVHCASLWRLHWDDDQKFVSLFYYLARHHGLHLYEQFGHFVTEAMDDAVLDRIFQVFTQALDELMALGFITPRAGTPAPGGGERVSSEGPLAPGQTERWLAASFDSNARRALNESFCLSLAGAVDVAALKAARQDVLQRHDAFRVSFAAEEPRQRLAPADAVAVAELDLRDRADASAALDDFCREASSRAFPLETAPLAAASLLHLADSRVVVHVVASHLVFDGWASSVFNAELAQAYRARSLGQAPQFTQPAESPLDFARAECERMDSADAQRALQYWTNVLRDPPPHLELGDRTPPAQRRFAGDTVRCQFDAALLSALRSCARTQGATLFQLLLASVSVLLRREGDQDEFVVSIPFASQSLGRHGPLLADGVLDLPLRLRCAAGDTGASVVARVRSHLMDALEHPLVTQGSVARALGIRSAGDKPPLTSVFFNLNPKVDLSGWAPLTATMHEGRKTGSLSQLFFNFYEHPDSLALDLHHSSEHFSPARAQALVDALRGIAAELARDSAAPLPLTPGAAPTGALQPDAPAVDPRLRQWNATAAPVDPRARVDAWIAAQAGRAPAAIALTVGEATLTYGALDARANRYAAVLRARGLGHGARIGLCLARGPELLPALLGVLKCGAAYVPLDPGFPRERLAYMAQDAGVALVITESAHADLSGVPRELQLRTDDDAAVIAAAPDAPVAPDPAWPADAAAYVIYTSGSTGKPKGVVVPQNAVCNFLASMRHTPGMAAGDRLLAVTTLSFDIAVLELLLPLTVGAHVVLARRDEAMDGEALGRMIHAHRVNVMQATPTTWHMLLDAGWSAPAGLKALCGGEPLAPSLAARLLAQGIELWNMYGPTETTVWSTLARVPDASQKVTIGRPIDNTQVWILDEQQRPCPVGAEGEICIGGLGVALGYHGRPDLSAERFIADPFSSLPGARLYRTGDLGRWREDGWLEHLGRLDFQVKIRGYRIELGEIEARLAALPGVARTVAVAREDTPGDVRLVAYAVPQPEARLDAQVLRESLRAGLPDYTLPQQVVLLDAMPVLPNGKIDRKALPAPTVAPAESQRSLTAPRNETERIVAQAMATVLKLPAVGIDEDFFALGGHSLLAARLIAQVNKAVGLHLNMRVLFESPTVEALARRVDQQRGVAAPVRAPIVHQPGLARAPLTLMQERIRFVEEMQPGRIAYNAASAHRLRGPMDLQAFDRAFRTIVQRQPSLRTAIVPGPDGYEQVVSGQVDATLLPPEDLTVLAPDRREHALQERLWELAGETFQLDHAPLFKARLFRLAADHHVLFFSAHHIVWDGWSFDIFYDEMNALYGAFLHGHPSPLAPLALTYTDYALWHSRWIDSAELQQQLEYWTRQYLRHGSVRAPATDRSRTADAANGGATEFLRLDAEQAERVRDLARRTGCTLSIVALSLYAALVSRLIDDSAPTIGVPVRGRPEPDVEPVMGFFNNVLPIRLPVQTSMSCLDWIGAVRAVVLDAFAHQDVPFERVAHALEAAQPGQHGQLYQAMFSFQDARNRPRHWGPLEHERVRIARKDTTEDLNLWLVEIAAGIEGGINFNADVYLPATAQALRDRFVRLLARMAERPEQSLAQLLAATPAEMDALAASEPAPAPVDDIVTLLDQRAQADGDAILVRCGDRALSLADVARRVASTAQALRPQLPGGRASVVVAVADPIAQLVASFAVLQCDCTLQVLDPAEANAALAASPATTPCVIIAEPALHSMLPAGLQAVDAGLIAGWHDARIVVGAAATAAAGTTPLPISRALLSQLSVALGAQVQLLRGDRALELAAHSPAMALTLCCLALRTGAELVLPPPGSGSNPDAAAALAKAELAAARVGFVHATPAQWEAILDNLDRASLPLMGTAVAAVDVQEMTSNLARHLLRTSASVLSVLRPAALPLPVAAGWVTRADEATLCGRPLVGQLLQVATTPGSPCAPGESARLWLRDGASERLVDSGLRARWRVDQQLQYLGEAAAVAAVEGVRIDLRALQTLGAGLPGVADAAATVLDGDGGSRTMLVGLRPAAGAASDDVAARVLAAVPAAARGRVRVGWYESLARRSDGRLHPSQSRPLQSTAAGFVGTPTEQAIHSVWSELLGTTAIRGTDNFFDLGGASLTAMQAVALLERRLGRRVSARRYVFESLSQLAAAYDEAAAEPHAGPIPAAASRPQPGMLDRLVRLVRRA